MPNMLPDLSVMTQSEIESFVQAGAFVRRGEQVWVWFDLEVKRSLPVTKALVLPNSVFYQNFYQNTEVNELCFRQKKVLNLKAFLQFLDANKGALSLRESEFSAPQPNEFMTAFQWVQRQIANGKIDKGVPLSSRELSRTPHRQDLLHMVSRSCLAPLNLYAYGFWTKDHGVIGVSPETLFEVDHGHLKTMALAGTYPKTANPEAMLEDKKERYEHQLVIDDIVKQLGSYGKVRTGETFVLELPSLFHLKTPIECELQEGTSIFKILEKLHPTPALGVSPRAADFKIMQVLPRQKEREAYGAPVLFPLSFTQNLCIVAIRNLEWSSGRTRVQSGCGVVKDSLFEKEWSEIQNKMNSVFKILGLA